MPLPNRSMVHVDRPLTNISVAYQQSQNVYIADRVFPRVPVRKQSDKYFKYTKGDWFRTEAAIRPPSSESAGSGYRLTTDSYYAEVYALHKDIDDQLRANTDQPINLDREATNFVTNGLLLRRDKLWAANYFSTSVWGTDLTGVSASPTAGQFLQWDQAGSDPIQDIADEKTAIQEATGVMPNVLVIGPYVYTVLRNNAAIIDRIKYTQRGVLTRELLASLLDVDEVVVANATENTAREGAAESMSYVFGKQALLVHRATSPGLQTVSGGYIFPWSGLLGANAFGTAISRFSIRKIKSDRVEGEMAFDMKVVAPDVGTFFDSAVA